MGYPETLPGEVTILVRAARRVIDAWNHGNLSVEVDAAIEELHEAIQAFDEEEEQ